MTVEWYQIHRLIETVIDFADGGVVAALHHLNQQWRSVIAAWMPSGELPLRALVALVPPFRLLRSVWMRYLSWYVDRRPPHEWADLYAATPDRLKERKLSVLVVSLNYRPIVWYTEVSRATHISTMLQAAGADPNSCNPHICGVNVSKFERFSDVVLPFPKHGALRADVLLVVDHPAADGDGDERPDDDGRAAAAGQLEQPAASDDATADAVGIHRGRGGAAGLAAVHWSP